MGELAPYLPLWGQRFPAWIFHIETATTFRCNEAQPGLHDHGLDAGHLWIGSIGMTRPSVPMRPPRNSTCGLDRTIPRMRSPDLRLPHKSPNVASPDRSRAIILRMIGSLNSSSRVGSRWSIMSASPWKEKSGGGARRRRPRSPVSLLLRDLKTTTLSQTVDEKMTNSKRLRPATQARASDRHRMAEHREPDQSLRGQQLDALPVQS